MAERDAKGRFVAAPKPQLPMRVELEVVPGRQGIGRASETELGWYIGLVPARMVGLATGYGYLGDYQAEALVVRADGRLDVWPWERMRWAP